MISQLQFTEKETQNNKINLQNALSLSLFNPLTPELNPSE
jgi:hypothetical protein